MKIKIKVSIDYQAKIKKILRNHELADYIDVDPYVSL